MNISYYAHVVMELILALNYEIHSVSQLLTASLLFFQKK